MTISCNCGGALFIAHRSIRVLAGRKARWLRPRRAARCGPGNGLPATRRGRPAAPSGALIATSGLRRIPLMSKTDVPPPASVPDTREPTRPAINTAMAPFSERARSPETGGDRNSHFGELPASIMPPGSAEAAPARRAASKAQPVKKQSIGEISIATAAGRDFGNSRRAGADEGQPQEPQQSGPKGRRDRLPRIPRSELESPGAVASINLPSAMMSAKGMEGLAALA